MAERRREHAWVWALAAIVAAGAALRFATLSTQSFWLDEAVTHQLVTKPLRSMLSAIPHSESTPPLYYVLAWVWVRIFGSGEAGLRSLSALLGTAAIVVLALIARRLAGNRAALAAAALAATNPLLIWYSQEARAYILLVTLCALSLWFLLREDWRGFALASALALASHYFAVFIVVPEVCWVLWRYVRGDAGSQRRAASWALVFIGVVGAALLPLAIKQAGGNRAGFITATSLGTRLVQVPKQFLIGYSAPNQTLLTVLAVLAAAGIALGLRRGDRGLLWLALIATGVPVLLVAFGVDYVLTRNLIAAMVPLVALAAVAATRTRAGPVLIAALCAIGVVTFAGVEGDVLYQRDDWRGVAQALGPATHGTRIVVMNPSDGVPALAIYAHAPLQHLAPGQPFRTREMDIVNLEHNPPPPRALQLDGFAPCGPPIQTPQYVVLRFCSTIRQNVSYASFESLSLTGRPPSILIWR